MKETRPNNAEIVLICVLFAFLHSLGSVKILLLQSVAATVPTPFSRPHPSKGRVESLNPCRSLPQTLPSGSPPLQFLLPLSSYSGCRRLAQQSKARFRRGVREGEDPSPKNPLHSRSPSIFSEGAEFDSEFIPSGEGDLFFKYTDKCGHDGAH